MSEIYRSEGSESNSRDRRALLEVSNHLRHRLSWVVGGRDTLNVPRLSWVISDGDQEFRSPRFDCSVQTAAHESLLTLSSGSSAALAR